MNIDLPEEMTVICSCGAFIVLQNEGGQYPEFYSGKCSDCGHEWRLCCLTALNEEDENE